MGKIQKIKKDQTVKLIKKNELKTLKGGKATIVVNPDALDI